MFLRHYCAPPSDGGSGDRKIASFSVATAPRAALCNAPSPPPAAAAAASSPLSPVAASAWSREPSNARSSGGAMPSPARSAATHTSASRRSAVPSARSRAQNVFARVRSSGTRWVAAVLRRRRCARASCASAVWARDGSVVVRGGAGGWAGAGRRWRERARARKRAWRRDQSVSCHCCVVLCVRNV